jgi:hypothetical protein
VGLSMRLRTSRSQSAFPMDDAIPTGDAWLTVMRPQDTDSLSEHTGPSGRLFVKRTFTQNACAQFVQGVASGMLRQAVLAGAFDF